jgi:hypothetical protein
MQLPHCNWTHPGALNRHTCIIRQFQLSFRQTNFGAAYGNLNWMVRVRLCPLNLTQNIEVQLQSAISIAYYPRAECQGRHNLIVREYKWVKRWSKEIEIHRELPHFTGSPKSCGDRHRQSRNWGTVQLVKAGVLKPNRRLHWYLKSDKYNAGWFTGQSARQPLESVTSNRFIITVDNLWNDQPRGYAFQFISSGWIRTMRKPMSLMPSILQRKHVGASDHFVSDRQEDPDRQVD